MVFEQEKEWEEFRKAHPELRFWQALRAFAGVDFIWLEKEGDKKDCFYWQDIKWK